MDNPTPPTANNIPPQNPTVETPSSQVYTAPQPPPSPHKSFFSSRIVLLVIILLILFGAGGTYLALNSKTLPAGRQAKPPPIAPQLTPTPSPTPIDETANWKTYSDSKSGISFKYPSDYIVKSFVDNPGIINIASSESRFNELSQHITIDARLKDAYTNYDNAVRMFLQQFKIDQTHQINSANDTVIASSGPYSLPFVKDSNELYEKHYYWRYKNGAVTAHYANVDIDQTKIYDQILSTFKFTQ